MHGTLQRSGLLALTIIALAAPAIASGDPMEYDLTVGDAPTSGVTTTIADGATTFRSTGPEPATLAAADVNAELAAGRDVAIVDDLGTLSVATPLTGAGRSLSLEAPEGDIQIHASIVAGTLSLDGDHEVWADADLRADRTAVHSLERVHLDGDHNHLGRLALHEEGYFGFARVSDAGALTLAASRVSGVLGISAAGGIDVVGDLVTGGVTWLEADSDAPPTPDAAFGDFTTAPGVTIDAGGNPVIIHSAHRVVDRLGPGLMINGQAYVPGPALVTSARERWGLRWPSDDSGAVPFRFDFEDSDWTAPTVRVDFVTAGPPYFHVNDIVRFTQSCEDPGGSGVASCTSNQHPDGTLDTAKLGRHLATVTATDAAGNTKVAYRAYLVIPVAKPCVAPTAATFKIARPRGVRGVVATLGGKRQKVKLSTTRIRITVDVRGRKPGSYRLKVTIRRGHGRKTIVRRPKVIVSKCVASHAG